MTMTNKSSASSAMLEYRVNIERMANEYLTQIVEPNRVKLAVGRLAIAMRALGGRNPKLFSCTPASLANAIAMCALTNLYPGGPQADCWLIPRDDKRRGVTECNWQFSWRGLKKQAQRAGYDVQVILTTKGEPLEIEPGVRWSYKPSPERALPASLEEVRGAIVTARPLAGGETSWMWVPEQVILQRRKKAKDLGIWGEWPVEMAYKAALIYAINRSLISIDDPDFQVALEHDFKADEKMPELVGTRDFDDEPTKPPENARKDLGPDGLAETLKARKDAATGQDSVSYDASTGEVIDDDAWKRAAEAEERAEAERQAANNAS